MFKTILVPLDGSALASQALPYAASVAKAAGGRVVLYHAQPKLAMPGETTFDIASAVAELSGQGIKVETVTFPLYHEQIGELILGAARVWNADLIVMSTHGRGGLGRWLYGSVADQVLRKADRPVLLVPASCDRAWRTDGARRMLVPLDGSSLSEVALDPARDLAGAMRADVILLRVVESTQESARLRRYGTEESGPEFQRARDYLQSIAARFDRVAKSVDVFADTGRPTSTIAKVAQDEEIDLIVMASHGRGGVARVVLGSVATGALQRAGTPVLIVRPASIRTSDAQPLPDIETEEREPFGPPVTLTLSPREAQLTRTALELLLSSSQRDEHLAAPLHTILNRLIEPEGAASAATGARSV